MKTKEERIKAWLDFIQADLDALPLDKLILIIHPIYEDILLYQILKKKAYQFYPLESSGNQGVMNLPKELRKALKIIDSSGWDKLAVTLGTLSKWNWGGLQKEARKFMEKIMAGPDSFVMVRVDEFLVEVPPGIFRKVILSEGGIEREAVPILIDLFDGFHKSAFKCCPECKRWFFHLSKRKREFCTNRCASRHLTRKKRTESEEAKEKYRKKMRDYMKKRHQENNPIESVVVECLGNFEQVTVTPTECINGNEINIRNKFDDCRKCPHSTKEGLPITRKEE
ncbi:MAG: hypothetical protein ACETWT_11965 [Thermodesulfobacteriota bacterium]